MFDISITMTYFSKLAPVARSLFRKENIPLAMSLFRKAPMLKNQFSQLVSPNSYRGQSVPQVVQNVLERAKTLKGTIDTI